MLAYKAYNRSGKPVPPNTMTSNALVSVSGCRRKAFRISAQPTDFSNEESLLDAILSRGGAACASGRACATPAT